MTVDPDLGIIPKEITAESGFCIEEESHGILGIGGVGRQVVRETNRARICKVL